MRTMIMLLVAAVALLAACSGDDTGTDPNGGNNAPAAPTNPQPASGATGVSTATQLTWQCSDLDGDAITYDVAFGTANPPAIVSSNLTSTSHNPGQLNQSMTYYWKVTATDAHGAATSGPVWNFTTGSGASGLTLLGSYDTPGYAYDVAVQGSYLYVADGSSGLLIMDVSNPANPALRGTFNPGSIFQNVVVSGDFAYLPASVGTMIVNIATPNSPSQAALAPFTGRIVVQGQYAYATQSGGLRIFDISDPYNPASRGFLSTGGSSRRVSVSGQYAFVTTNPTSAVHRILITNPDLPQTAGSYTTGGDVPLAIGNRLYLGNWVGVQIIGPSLTALGTWRGSDIRGLAYESSHVFVASPDSGVVVLDVSQESQPTEVVRLNVAGTEEAVVVAGNIVYVAAGYSGIHVLRYDP